MLGPFCRSEKFARSSSALLFTVILLSLCAAAADQVSSGPPDLETIVRRMTQAELQNVNRTKPYSLTREYQIFGAEAAQPRTSVLARINFLPPNVKSYDIDQSTGGIGEKVVRHILDHEVDATRNPQQMLITDQNYDFALLGEEAVAGYSCYKLNITPRHPRKDLLKAAIWVDKDTYRIVRMEGDAAKSPSFWVKDLHLILDFGEVAGMWMQTATHAAARMRFGGEYKIVSQNLNYDVAQAVAVNARPGRRHSSAIMAASVQ